MSNHEEHRPLDRDAAELLLSGDPAARDAHPWLGAVLTAAAAPGTGGELSGADAAVAAFAAAHDPSARPRRRSMLKTTLAKLLTVKVAAACVAVVGGAGGVALAAGTGALPTPLHRPPSHAAKDASHSARPHPSGTPSARPSHSLPPIDLAKLCQRWEARPGAERGRALDEPEFGNLVRQAGRRDRSRVDHFCADLRRPSPSPSLSSKPYPRPSGSARPEGSGVPGPRPSSPPSGPTRPEGR